MALNTGSEISPTALSAVEPGRRALPRLSMVVLPLANIGGGPEQEHFADGVTESLTTDLSRIRNAVVIARNTAFAYKGKPLDAKTIGRELNVRYVIEGSVQRSGGRMRVNVQLIDAETGSHLWAERFDKPVADLFDMQDEIVARLASQLRAELTSAEARRAEQAPNPDSWTSAFRVRLGFIRVRLLTIWPKRGAFLIARSPPIPTMSTRSLDRRAARIAVAATSLLADPLSGLYCGRSEIDQSLVLDPEPSARPYVAWTYRYKDEAGHRGHCRDVNMHWSWTEISHRPIPLIGYGKLFVGRAEETEPHIAQALRRVRAIPELSPG